MFCSPPGSSVLGISQGRTMERVAISFSRGSSWPRDGTCISNSASGFFTTSHLGSPFVTLYRGGTWHFGNQGLRGSTPNKKRKLKFKRRSHMDWMFVAPQIHGLKPYSPAACWFLRWGYKEVIRIQNSQEDGALRMRWAPLSVEEEKQRHFSLSLHQGGRVGWGHSEQTATSKPGRWLSRPRPCRQPNLTLQPPELEKTHSCPSSPPVSFVRAVGANPCLTIIHIEAAKRDELDLGSYESWFRRCRFG